MVTPSISTDTEPFQIGVVIIWLFYRLVYIQLLKIMRVLESGFLLPDLGFESFQVAS